MANVVVNIIGDASKLKSALGESSAALGTFESKVKGFGDRMIDSGKKMSLAITLPIAALGAVGFKELEDAGKAAAQTNAVLKSTGEVASVTAGHVDKLASSLMHKAGVDDEAVKSSENLLLTFTNIRNETGKGNDIFDRATKATLDLSVALGKDLQSSSVLVGKALNDPVAGLTALNKAGVQFTPVQKDMIKNFVETGDIVSAQKIVLSELTKQVGGSAAAYGKTLAGQVSLAREELKNAAGTMVLVMAPALKLIAGGLQSVAGFLEHLDPVTRTAVASLAVFAAALGPLKVIIGGIAEGVAGLIKVAGLLGSAWESMALHALYAADAMKVMSLAQLGLIAGFGVFVAAAAVFAVWASGALSYSKDLAAAADKWGRSVELAAKRSGNELDNLKAVFRSLKEESAALTERLDKLRNAPSKTPEQTAEMYALEKQLEKVNDRIGVLDPKIKDLQNSHDDAAAAAAHQTQELGNLAAGTEDLATATDDARNAVMDLQSATLAASGGQLGYEQAVLNLTKAEEDYQKVLADPEHTAQQAAEAELNVRQARLSAAEAAIKLKDDTDDLIRKSKETPGAIQAEINKLTELRDQVTDPAVKDALQEQIDKLTGIRDAVNQIPAYKQITIDVARAGTGTDFSTATGLGFATGGTVPGPQGKPRLAIVHGGEQVLTPAQQAAVGSNGTIVIPVYVGGRQVAEIVASELNRAGGPKISQRAIA